MTFAAPLYAALDELALIRIAGADARVFLHGQLTQDIQQLPLGRAALAGYCTAKGRLLATMVVWCGQADEFWALVRADLCAALVKRLRMFVLRAKVEIAPAALKVWGLGLPAQEKAPAWQVQGMPEMQDNQGACRIAAPGEADGGLQRYWYVARADQPPGIAHSGTQTGEAAKAWAAKDWAAHWQTCDIRAGLAWVQAATQERFIPQTLNLDLIDGVSFTKGCYPGQEVVARSHYRGTLKRRMAAGWCAMQVENGEQTGGFAPFLPFTLFVPDADIFDANQPEQPWGRVVNLAVENNTAWLLFEAQLTTLDTADLRLGHPQGPAIVPHPLPYALVGNRVDRLD